MSSRAPKERVVVGKKSKQEYVIVEYPGDKKLEDIILEPLVDYINMRAGRTVVKIREEGEPSIFDQENKKL